MPTLRRLRSGTRLRLAEMPEISGILVNASESRAVVRLDCPERDVEFVDREGKPRQFRSRGTHVTSWAPTMVVEPVGFESHYQDEEHDMSKVKTAKAKGTKKAKDGKLTYIDTAAKMLGEKKAPMTTKEMIQAMASTKYWTSPGGKTPAATLYSAILREIKTKGKEARFKKSDRWQFVANG